MKKNAQPNIIKRIGASYVAPHKTRIIFAILSMMIVAGTTGGISYIIKPLINGFMNPDEIQNVYYIPSVIVSLFLVKGVANYFQAFLMEYVGQKVVADFQVDLYKKIINQDLSFFQKHGTAELASRFLFDLNILKRSITQTIVGVSRDGITVFALIAVMFSLDWKMALISLTAFPLAAYPIVKFGKKIRGYASGSQLEVGKLNAILKESFSHNRQVKTYTMENYETRRAQDSIMSLFKLIVKAARVRALSSPIMEMIGGFTIATVMLYGTHQVKMGATDPGTFMAFLAAAMSIYRPLKTITTINNAIQEGLSAAVRTFDLLDSESTVTEHVNAKTLQVARGEIEFRDVHLTYADGTKALENFNLTIKPGQTVALVGSSGAGKSSVLNLIPRFYTLSGGAIFIDGQNIAECTLKSLRQNIGLVTQDIAIFNDTIANNIAYGKIEGHEAATREEVEVVAQKAAAHDFIGELTHGYETMCGEEGFKLSGGQKQRISIARAMLKNAPILLLDEATSSLDTESERHVQDALNILMEGRTSLIVAHRLSTITHADIIYVMDAGKIAESGTHQELISKGGIYTRLYNMQMDAPAEQSSFQKAISAKK